MVRRYQRYKRTRRFGPRRRTYSKRGRFGRTMHLVRGRKFRATMKSKGSKWQKFVIFNNLLNAHELTQENAASALIGQATALNPAIPAVPGAAQIIAHDPDSREAHFGPLYAPGGAGAVDAVNNPTAVGDGMLEQLVIRDSVMGFTRWDYSSAKINAEYIGDEWDARNNAGGPLIAIPATAIFVKGLKINMLGRSTAMPGLMYLGYQKDAATPFKLREQVGKLRAYFKTARSAVAVPAGGRAFHWSIPTIYISGPLYTRYKITVYYKVKQLTVN